jgi:tetratricopeptide (TPR) repeat protein
MLNTGNYDSSLIFIQNALKLSEKLHDLKRMGQSYLLIGHICKYQGKLPLALDSYFKAIKLYEGSGNNKSTASPLGSIGAVYRLLHDYPKALEYNFKSLKIYEDLHRNDGISASYNNIGRIYSEQSQYKNALEYYFKNLKLYDEAKMPKNIGYANTLNNIGAVFENQKDSDYVKQGLDPVTRYSKMLEYYLKAFELYKNLNYNEGIATSLGNIGLVYYDQKKYAESINYLQKALALSEKMGSLDNIADDNKELSEVYDKAGQGHNAFQSYVKYITARDSMFNEENTKKNVRTEMNFNFEKKQALEKAEQEKKDVFAKQEVEKQKIIRNSFIAGFALMILLALLILRGYRQKQKANHIITLQKEEVERQKHFVEEQKDMVEEKQKEILDSIYYARRIQRALITSEKHIEAELKRLQKK